MIKRVLLTAVIAVAFAGPAFAGHCPKDMAAIDAALAKNPTLGAAQMTAVKKDRADGEALHKAAKGDHTEAMVTLCRARKVLGLECL